jgi:alanine-synthesizing transaminase
MSSGQDQPAGAAPVHRSPRLSSRVPRQLEATGISKLRMELAQQGVALLDLAGSNPTTVDLGDWSEQIADALHSPQSATYHPAALGSMAARRAVAGWFAKQSLSVEPGHIVLTASSSESYSFLFQLLCDPGDEVLVPAPSYPLLEHLAALAGVRHRTYRLWYSGEWLIDFAALEASIRENTRAIVVVNPNNPTGSYLRAFEAERLVKLCADRGLVLIADEVFWEYTLQASSDPPRFAAMDTEASVVSLGGLSKSAGMPQMKVGWMVLRGPAPSRERLREGLRWVADSYLSVSAPVQAALPRLLEIGGHISANLRERI